MEIDYASVDLTDNRPLKSCAYQDVVDEAKHVTDQTLAGRERGRRAVTELLYRHEMLPDDFETLGEDAQRDAVLETCLFDLGIAVGKRFENSE